VGAWGPGPFENDTSMDWVRELRKSADPGYPMAVLRKLDGVGPLACRTAEIGVAAAEAVMMSLLEFREWPKAPVRWSTQFMLDSEWNWLDGEPPIDDL